MKICLVAAPLILACTGPALAGESPSKSAQSSITLDGGVAAEASAEPKREKGPNDILCKKSNDYSSRLSRKKVCMTRAQYEERRMLDRDAIERGQANRQTR